MAGNQQEFSTFNWRDYVVIEPNRQHGPTSPAVREIEQAMDSLSRIPEFREMVLNSVANASTRNEQCHEMYGDPLRVDHRVRIQPGSGSPSFDGRQNSISISPEYLNQHSFSTIGRPPAPISVRSALVHEFSHGDDRNLTPVNELRLHQNAARSAIDATLTEFPEHRQEYDRHGTILGRQYASLLTARTPEAFLETMEGVTHSGMGLRRAETENDLPRLRQNLERASSRGEWPPEERRQILISNFFENTYRVRHTALNDARYELPAVAAANRINAVHFPSEPQRDGYGPPQLSRPEKEEPVSPETQPAKLSRPALELKM